MRRVGSWPLASRLAYTSGPKQRNAGEAKKRSAELDLWWWLETWMWLQMLKPVLRTGAHDFRESRFPENSRRKGADREGRLARNWELEQSNASWSQGRKVPEFQVDTMALVAGSRVGIRASESSSGSPKATMPSTVPNRPVRYPRCPHLRAKALRSLRDCCEPCVQSATSASIS
jgi:hypothetical protein